MRRLGGVLRLVAVGRRVGRVLVQEAALAHLRDRLFDRADDALDVFVGVGGREDAPARLADEDALLQKVEVEEVGILHLAREEEAEERLEVRDAKRVLVPLEVRVERRGEARNVSPHLLAQRRAALLDVLEHRVDDRHQKRVHEVCAGDKCRLRLRERGVAVLPHAAVHGVHVGGLAPDGRDRQPSRHRLAERHEVGLDAEQGARAAGVEAEARHDFVEDEHGSRGVGDAPQLVEELAEVEVGAAALPRLDHDGGEFVSLRAQVFEAARVVHVEQDDVLDHVVRDAGGHRHGARLSAAAALPPDHHAVERPVIAALEERDFGAPRGDAREPERRHHGLRARVAELHALHAGQLAEQLGRLARVGRARADLQPEFGLLAQRVHDEFRRVAVEQRAEAHRDVNVLVAVHVPDS